MRHQVLLIRPLSRLHICEQMVPGKYRKKKMLALRPIHFEGYRESLPFDLPQIEDVWEVQIEAILLFH